MDRYQCLELFYGHGGCLSLAPDHGGCPSPPPLMGGATCRASDVPVIPCSDAKVSFFKNLLKKPGSGSSSQKKIFGFLYLFLKLSLTLPHKGKCFGVHILGV